MTVPSLAWRFPALSWQIPSALAGVGLVFPLNLRINTHLIGREVAAVLSQGAFTPQNGPHHNGKWSRLGLVSPSGDPSRTYPKKGEPRLPTPILDAMPAVMRLFDNLGGPVRSATLSKMAPGAHVDWHTDNRQSLDLSYVRLHVPVVTDPAARMTLAHQRVHLSPDAIWYGDFTFPHTVHHRGNRDRIHIMVDVPSHEGLYKLFPERFHRERLRRKGARRTSRALFSLYERYSTTGREALDYRRRRDEAIARGDDVRQLR